MSAFSSQSHVSSCSTSCPLTDDGSFMFRCKVGGILKYSPFVYGSIDIINLTNLVQRLSIIQESPGLLRPKGYGD